MPHYAAASDFRKALLARLHQWAETKGWDPKDAARAFALQQLTSRLFRSDSAQSWVLTGGTALLYRSTEARPTSDADLAFAADAAELSDTLERDLAPREGEYGSFEVAVKQPAGRGQHKVRIAYLVGHKIITRASLDVNTTRTSQLEPDTFAPEPFVSMPDV